MNDSAPPERPRFRESAAVVLLRGEAPGIEAFWVKRGEAVGYMPGFRAFIGGKVNAEDLDLPFEDAASFDETERAMRACAVREAFEEAGVLVALAAPTDPAPLAEARRALLADKAPFPVLVARHGWRFRAGALEPAGRWTTPPFASQRFDTMFFLARVPEGQEASIVPGELESGEWVRPAAALERWKRGEEAFAAPILHTLRELEDGGEGLHQRLAAGPTANARRIEIEWGIVLHPMKTRPLPPATHTNAYFVGERDVALVDPGSDDPEELESLFALGDALAAEGRRVRMVIATHHHPDHVGGIEAARARYRVRVAAHQGTAPHVRADVAFADGDWIPLDGGAGWNLRAIHTPGHTRGHLCLFHPRTGALLTGDHIPGGSGTVIVDPPEGDMAAYVASLEKLLPLGVRTLFPAHGSPQGGAARRIRGLIAHRLERENRVVAALAGEPLALGELVPIAYADTRPELWLYAERSLLAHLLKLEGEGRARREGERWRRA